MAVLTIHHWPDLEAGLTEVRRVVRRRIVILTYDPDRLDIFWNAHYFPELIEVERRRYPPIDRVSTAIGALPEVTPIPIPLDCTDGFQEAFYGRPEAFLEPAVRAAQSAWGFLDDETVSTCVDRLRADLESGDWDRRFGEHRRMQQFEGALRMLRFDLGH